MCTKFELQTVLKTVKNASLQLYGDKLNRIILFGSYARGDNTEESDIDIMIVLNCDTNEIKILLSLSRDMECKKSLHHDLLISLLFRDQKHFEDNLDFLPLYQNIAKEGIAVYG